jgi:hypothetical protein
MLGPTQFSRKSTAVRVKENLLDALAIEYH